MRSAGSIFDQGGIGEINGAQQQLITRTNVIKKNARRRKATATAVSVRSQVVFSSLRAVGRGWLAGSRVRQAADGLGGGGARGGEGGGGRGMQLTAQDGR